jgi:hypothetical protein
LHAHLECSRSLVWSWSGQTKDYKIGICCFSTKHTSLSKPRFLCRPMALCLTCWSRGTSERSSKGNSRFVAATLCRHISTFRGYRILFSIRNPCIYIASPIIFLFIHNHLTLRKWCCTPLQHDFALEVRSYDFIISLPFWLFFKHLSRDFEKTMITAMYHGRWFAHKQTKQPNKYFYCQS